jgi:hypothetical protein
MKEDFKNIIITFSLIALVFTQGSLAYQKKVYKDYVSTSIQGGLLTTNNSNLTKIEQNKILLNNIQQQQLANQQTILKQSANSTTTTSTPSTSTSTTTTQAQADIARQQALAQAQALAQQKAQLLAQQQALAQAQAQAQAQTPTPPSRQSAAS